MSADEQLGFNSQFANRVPPILSQRVFVPFCGDGTPFCKELAKRSGEERAAKESIKEIVARTAIVDEK